MSTKENLIHFWKEKNIVNNPLLIDAFRSVPREIFIAPNLYHLAYVDKPLPTIRNQSISQPTTIMIMLEALEIEMGHNVFELGAGVGYQAALLSKVVGSEGKCTTTDIIPELIHATNKNLTNATMKFTLRDISGRVIRNVALLFPANTESLVSMDAVSKNGMSLHDYILELSFRIR